MNMDDVRRELWEAYEMASRLPEGIEGKSVEACCEIHYPTIWYCNTLEEFMEPDYIMIYSYALGPSRRHYIYKGEEDKELDYNEWQSPDIFKKAVEVIRSWKYEISLDLEKEARLKEV